MHCARAATGVRYSQIFLESNERWIFSCMRNFSTTDISHTFCRSATKFGNVGGMTNRNLFPKFCELWSGRPNHAATYISPSVVRKLTFVKWLFDNYPMFAFANRFWATVCRVRRMLSDRSLSCLSVCLSVMSYPVCLSATLVYCGQTVGRIKMKLGMQVGLGPGHIALDGDHRPTFRGRLFVRSAERTNNRPRNVGLCGKISLLWMSILQRGEPQAGQAKVHPRYPDLSPVDRPHASFSGNFRRALRFRDIAGFVSQMPLLRIPHCLSPKIWSFFSRVRWIYEQYSAVSHVLGLIVMLFAENINLPCFLE